jgi:drug/metabolite transporter (DMT)-like permease
MVLLTGAAILCFAANSIFCRLALAADLIDPPTFTTVRILSAAVMLTAGVLLKYRRFPRWKRARPGSVGAVFVYLVFFSFAYTRMGAATGALVLIAAVQLSMFCIALLQGERFALLSWLGFAVAAAGVLYLLLPSATAPDPLGAGLMAISGTAWGIFTILARGTDHPEETNAANMLGCLLPALLLNLYWLGDFHGTLSAVQAATVQLSMPAVVALGGVIFLAEPLSVRLLIASAAMLGGIAVVLAQRPTK